MSCSDHTVIYDDIGQRASSQRAELVGSDVALTEHCRDLGQDTYLIHKDIDPFLLEVN